MTIGRDAVQKTRDTICCNLILFRSQPVVWLALFYPTRGSLSRSMTGSFFGHFSAVRRLFAYFLKLFKKFSKTVFTKSETRVNIPHSLGLSAFFMKGGLFVCC